MYMPIHGLDGTVMEPLNPTQTTVSLDPASACLLQRRLGAGNHTYLVITARSGVDYEVVRIDGVVNDKAIIVRAMDGTTALDFAVGSRVLFDFTESAIQEIVLQKSLAEVVLEGSGAVEVTRTAPNTYNIFVPHVTLESQSPDIVVSGEYPNFVVTAPVKNWCCGPSTPPPNAQ